MPASPDLWLYFLLVLGIIVLPGMDMAYVATHALVGGLRGGLTAVGGIVTGGLVHMAVAATGLGALMTLWPGVFDGLLVAGASYMVWIGWTLLRASRATAHAAGPSVSPPGPPAGPDCTAAHVALDVYRRAVLTCLMNPKAYAFTIAVLPAYLATAERPLAVQAVLLSAITAATQFAVYGGVAATVASTRRLTGVSANAERWMLRVTGPALMAGAVLTLVFGWRPVQAQPVAPVMSTAAAPTSSTAHADKNDFNILRRHWVTLTGVGQSAQTGQTGQLEARPVTRWPLVR
jgi:threonine/homoserine/homoserine lactone efflux protein